jgi:ABC-type dipeptide/oligopeptide/nickel transport system ATPase component
MAEESRIGSGLVVHDLCIDYRVEMRGHARFVPAVRNVSLQVEAGQTLGILGETGSGKSSMGFAIMRLLPETARWSGDVSLGDLPLSSMPRKQLERVRGRDIGMIFQDASTALNPVRTVGAQIIDTARAHDSSMSRSAARKLAGDTLEELGVSRERLDSYPHQLSGGMRQRALIATVMIANPKFIIADEPTASLDKVTERQIVLLLRRLQKEKNLGFVMISHDIGIVSALCRDVLIMYKGDVVETGRTQSVLRDPQHPYTKRLIQATKRERDVTGRLRLEPRESSEVGS